MFFRLSKVLPELLIDLHGADVALYLAVRAARLLIVILIAVTLSGMPVRISPVAAGTLLLAVARAMGGLEGLSVSTPVTLVPGHSLLVVLPVAAVHRTGKPGHESGYVPLPTTDQDSYDNYCNSYKSDFVLIHCTPSLP